MNIDPHTKVSDQPRRPDRDSRSKVLLFLIGSLGDTLVALPSMRAIRSHFSDSEIVLLQNVQSGGLVAAKDVVPKELVDRHLTYVSDRTGLARIKEYGSLWSRIRAECFDTVVYLVLTERGRVAVLRDRLFFRSCGIPRDLGFLSFSSAELFPLDTDGYPANTIRESERKLERLARTGLRINASEALKQPSILASGEELDKVKKWLRSKRGTDGPLVALAPGCKTQANEWSIDNFKELGQRIVRDQRAEIVIVGGPADAELGRSLVDSWGQGINAAGEFKVSESAGLLSMCDAYIGPDTGTMHLAAAVGTSCFVIAGSRTNPGQWFPLGNTHMVVQHRVKCAGCHLLECPVAGHPCTEGVSVDAAWELLKGFLNAKPESMRHVFV
jgi:heptosyltransferase III